MAWIRGHGDPSGNQPKLWRQDPCTPSRGPVWVSVVKTRRRHPHPIRARTDLVLPRGITCVFSLGAASLLVTAVSQCFFFFFFFSNKIILCPVPRACLVSTVRWLDPVTSLSQPSWPLAYFPFPGPSGASASVCVYSYNASSSPLPIPGDHLLATLPSYFNFPSPTFFPHPIIQVVPRMVSSLFTSLRFPSQGRRGRH